MFNLTSFLQLVSDCWSRDQAQVVPLWHTTCLLIMSSLDELCLLVFILVERLVNQSCQNLVARSTGEKSGISCPKPVPGSLILLACPSNMTSTWLMTSISSALVWHTPCLRIPNLRAGPVWPSQLSFPSSYQPTVHQELWSFFYLYI